MFKLIRYYFVCADGEVFISLPSVVSDDTIRVLMSDIGASKVYVLVSGTKLFKELS